MLQSGTFEEDEPPTAALQLVGSSSITSAQWLEDHSWMHFLISSTFYLNFSDVTQMEHAELVHLYVLHSQNVVAVSLIWLETMLTPILTWLAFLIAMLLETVKSFVVPQNYLLEANRSCSFIGYALTFS